jgi:hypothetical protein
MLQPRDDASTAEPIFKLYHYNPSIAGAVIFVLLFVGTTGLHFYQLSRARTWFMIPFAIGGICKSLLSLRKVTTQWLINPSTSSGMHRVCSSSPLWPRIAKLEFGSIHHPITSHSHRPGSICSHHIYGIGAHHHTGSRRILLSDP